VAAKKPEGSAKPKEKSKEKSKPKKQGGDHRPKAPAAPRPPSRLRDRYMKEIIPQLRKEFDYPNVMQVPRLEKVVVNMGLGEAVQNNKVLEAGVEEMSLITGQRPVVTRAKRSIAGFKLRAGMTIGAMVTLRGDRMYEFFDRLVSVAMPRVRDFKGVSGTAFDGRGNYSLGIREQVIFPEINYDNIDQVRGFGITVVTTAKTDEEGKALLKLLGMPFRN
jgi:large subunit ribosomal protein L5